MKPKDRKYVDSLNDAEKADLARRLEEACETIQDELDDFDRSPFWNQVMARNDQVKARCRDDAAFRERVIAAYVERGSQREDVEAWLNSTED